MSYVIFGRRVLNEHLAVGTLAVFGTGVALAMRGGSKTDKSQIPAPAITSSSKFVFFSFFFDLSFSSQS
ncbi:hypothetical protein Pst134EA_013641 [Puccinia striiformis f. sp. tritici]|uniref:hypothetical protein n=1 Tax=Puccinia striiformis f. sp. tritici TaxID=168172 RepID=UPI002008AF8F|nr:hypothetical protein Pst134EA_013641 [Puccinia striiformis f. sp. tritici]KAH9465774.1 hypothetical protein Pst134EA_013641 [Puccinia striiformis f. sp. tritici]